jgi:antitoxin MazE
MEAVIKKWGNSLGIRIPKFIVKELSLKDGSSVEIEDKEGQIIIHPKNVKNLHELLQKINKTNIHSEVETNGPIGQEIW